MASPSLGAGWLATAGTAAVAAMAGCMGSAEAPMWSPASSVKQRMVFFMMVQKYLFSAFSANPES